MQDEAVESTAPVQAGAKPKDLTGTVFVGRWQGPTVEQGEVAKPKLPKKMVEKERPVKDYFTTPS